MTSRRELLKTIASSSLAMTPLPFLGSKGAQAGERDSDPLLIEHWMDQWIASTRLPVGTLEVSRFKDPIYFLLKPIAWKPNDASGQLQSVTAPAGFVTDFASVPRLFWSLLRPDGDYAYAAVIHDYLYWTQTAPKETADATFKAAMEDFGVGAVTVTAIYKAVQFGGASAWRENARLKAAGERRFLKVYPDDPRISWDEWKKRPGVFRDEP